MSSSALMKRARVETFPPKMVRRSAKRGGGGNGPSGRVNESFLTSTHLFVYFRLSIIWIALLSFDFLSGGFRFELLWPTWLLLRSGYDAFAYRSTTAHLPYSAQAFSLFFVCITITSDLLCFLFIPVPLLLFVASSYVWVHHIWQSSDRTFSTPAAVSYAIVILFEYIWRYGYESPWLPYRSIASAMGLSRLLPTRRLDAYDAQAANNFPWPLLMCRPFAAHCLGYPLVMFGFEARMFWTNWRMKRKQREIVKANEYYTELLCTAVPCVYEAGKRYMFSHVSPLGQYDNEVCAEYEMDQQTTTAMLTPALAAPGPSPTSATTPSPASNSSSNASTTTVCGNGNNNNAVALYNGGPGAGGASGGGGLNSVPTTTLATTTATSKKSRASFSHKNGNSRLQYLKRHGQANSHGISNGSSHNGTSAHLNGHDDTDTSSERGRSRSPLVVRTRSPMIVRAISRLLRALVVEPLLFLTRFLMNSLSSVGSSAPPETNGSLENYGSSAPSQKAVVVDKYPHRLIPLNAQPHSSCSTQGGHSGPSPSDAAANEADDSQGDGESEDGHQNQNSTCSSSKSSHAGSSSSRKNRGGAVANSRRARGRTPQQAAASAAAFVDSTSSQPSTNNNNHLLQTGNNTSYCNSTTAHDWESGGGYAGEPGGKESKGNKKESQDLEKLRSELRAERDRYAEIKTQEQKAQKQLAETKAKHEQLDVKLTNMTRLRDQEKSNAHGFERRLNELIAKKTEIDGQLISEKKRSSELTQKVDDLQQQLKNVSKTTMNGVGKQPSKENAPDETLKSKYAALEREMKTLRQDLKARDDTVDERDAELKQLREFRDSHCEEKVRQIIEQLQVKNVHLEASLRAENKLKQELFRALGVTRDQIDVLRERVHYLEKQIPEFAANSTPPVPASSSSLPLSHLQNPLALDTDSSQSCAFLSSSLPMP